MRVWNELTGVVHGSLRLAPASAHCVAACILVDFSLDALVSEAHGGIRGKHGALYRVLERGKTAGGDRAMKLLESE